MAIPIPIPTRLRSSSNSTPKSSSSPSKYPGGFGTWTRSSSSPTGIPPLPTAGTPPSPVPHNHSSTRSRTQQQLARDSVRRECGRIVKLVAQREGHFEKVVMRLNRFISAEQDRAIKDVAKTLKQMLIDEKLLRKDIEGLEAMRLSQEMRMDREVTRITRLLPDLAPEQLQWEFEGLTAVQGVMHDQISWETERIQLAKRTFDSELSQKLSSLHLAWEASKDRMTWDKHREKDGDVQEAKMINDQVDAIRVAGVWSGQDKMVDEHLDQLARLLATVWTQISKRWAKQIVGWLERDKWVEGEMKWLSSLQHEAEESTTRELNRVVDAVREGERRLAEDLERLDHLRMSRPATPPPPPRPSHRRRQHSFHHTSRPRFHSPSPERPHFRRTETEPDFTYTYEHAGPSRSHPAPGGAWPGEGAGAGTWDHDTGDARAWEQWQRERTAGNTPWATDAEDVFGRDKIRRDRSRERAREEKKEAQHRKIVTAWESYQSRWATIQASHPPPHPSNIIIPPAGESPQWLSFRDIPWPVVRTPSTPSSLTSDRIATFLLSTAHSMDKSRKDRLRNAILFWHPDKWEGKWLNRVDPEERVLVKEAIGFITTALNELMRAEAARRTTV